MMIIVTIAQTINRVILMVTLMCLLDRMSMILGPDDCESYCVSQSDAGVMPYGTCARGSDIYENAIALQRTGSVQPVNCVLGAVCSGVPC